ncbi:CRISPR-associated endonuclease Cas2 [Candidatus Alkanophaga liquidiphilum]
MRRRPIYVVYDIRDDKLRNELARRLRYYGLHRVQYSVFAGAVPRSDKNRLVEEVRNMALDADDKVHILEICERCKKRAVSIGKTMEQQEHLIL